MREIRSLKHVTQHMEILQVTANWIRKRQIWTEFICKIRVCRIYSDLVIAKMHVHSASLCSQTPRSPKQILHSALLHQHWSLQAHCLQVRNDWSLAHGYTFCLLFIVLFLFIIESSATWCSQRDTFKVLWSLHGKISYEITELYSSALLNATGCDLNNASQNLHIAPVQIPPTSIAEMLHCKHSLRLPYYSSETWPFGAGIIFLILAHLYIKCE